jgi:hypothetical protein
MPLQQLDWTLRLQDLRWPRRGLLLDLERDPDRVQGRERGLRQLDQHVQGLRRRRRTLLHQLDLQGRQYHLQERALHGVWRGRHRLLPWQYLHHGLLRESLQHIVLADVYRGRRRLRHLGHEHQHERGLHRQRNLDQLRGWHHVVRWFGPGVLRFDLLEQLELLLLRCREQPVPGEQLRQPQPIHVHRLWGQRSALLCRLHRLRGRLQGSLPLQLRFEQRLLQLRRPRLGPRRKLRRRVRLLHVSLRLGQHMPNAHGRILRLHVRRVHHGLLL